MPPLTTRRVALTLLVVLGLGGAGCGGESGGASSEASTDLPDREPEVTGVVGLGDEYPEPPYLLEPTNRARSTGHCNGTVMVTGS